jgi:hypothetical protein
VGSIPTARTILFSMIHLWALAAQISLGDD